MERTGRSRAPGRTAVVAAVLLCCCAVVVHRAGTLQPSEMIQAGGATGKLRRNANKISAALAKVNAALARKSAGGSASPKKTQSGGGSAALASKSAKGGELATKLSCLKGWSGPHCEVHGTWGGPPLQHAAKPTAPTADGCLAGWHGTKCNIRGKDWLSKKERGLQRISNSMAALARLVDSQPSGGMLGKIEKKMGTRPCPPSLAHPSPHLECHPLFKIYVDTHRPTPFHPRR